jgi:hypothetical protein
MIPRNSILRVARPTDQLHELAKMYVEGLGFEVLSEFAGHNDFDGVILGHPNHSYHLEFTHHRGTHVGGPPTMDNLLVFYVPDHQEWESCCSSMLAAGFKDVVSYNEYWDQVGKTFADSDGYRVVIQNAQWSK